MTIKEELQAALDHNKELSRIIESKNVKISGFAETIRELQHENTKLLQEKDTLLYAMRLLHNEVRGAQTMVSKGFGFINGSWEEVKLKDNLKLAT